MKLVKTQEQIDVVQAAKENSTLKIEALAGAAKTSTLAMVAEEIQEKSLLLVFNKAAQVDALSRFPDHVEVRTTHSLAYQAIGYQYQSKLSRPKGGYVNVCGTGSEIAKYFGVKPIKGGLGVVTEAYIGLMAKNTVNKFESSSDDKMSSDHLVGIEEAITRYEVSQQTLSSTVLKVANKLWQGRIDICSDVMATHDTYMKLFQLSKPILDYKVIYLDESQDTTDCVLDIFTRQERKDVRLIVVGDSHQAIYGWRGAINAMKKLDYPTKTLSTTFRFGQELSNLASKILGGVKVNSFTGLSTEVGVDMVDTDKPYTVLYRTNGCLILDAVKLLSKGKSMNLEVDVSDFLRKLESANFLYLGNNSKVKHEDIIAFTTWSDLVTESKCSGELSRIKSIVEEGKVAWVVSNLKKQSNTTTPHITFTTAHKSKGREWDQVILADDFPSCYQGNKWVGLTDTETNLLYVASTRAKKALSVNDTIEEITSFSCGVQSPLDFVTIRNSNYEGGDMANFDLECKSAKEELRDKYNSGEMSMEEAFDLGLVGDSEEQYSSVTEDPILTYEESLSACEQILR